MPLDSTSRGSTSWYSWSPNRPRRRSSNALPHREVGDRFEKADRHHRRAIPMKERVQAAWMNSSQRVRFVRTAAIVLIVLSLVWFFSPSDTSRLAPGGAPKLPNLKSTFSGGDVASDPSVATERCTKSYSKEKPLLQYALMIDAGSTGSRIHVYRFNNCGPTPELEDEVFMMTPKKEGGSGLSAYKGDPEAAAQSLDILLDKAVESVPEKLQGCSPIAVKATAGLRKIGPEASEAILKAVRARLETKYPFPLVSDDKGGVQVMDGTDEGVYAWITTNYLLGKIGTSAKTPTAAVFDLGGGSTQIVFEPTFPEKSDGFTPTKMQEGDHKYELSFGGRRFELYQHSYLGYGLMEARNSLHKTLLEHLHETTDSSAFLQENVVNPCIAPGYWKKVDVSMGSGHALGETVTVNMTGPSYGSPAQCRNLAEKMLHKGAECKIGPCAFNGVYQPALRSTFKKEDVYLFSYFYDRIQPLGMPDTFSLRELRDLASNVCDGEKAWGVFSSVEGAMDELTDRPDTCLDLSYMLALLQTGYDMPIDREVKIAKKIKGNELGWCLGASLPLLNQESGWKCKIKQVA